MKPSRAWMVVRLLLAVSLLVPASAGWCAETQERYIKRLGVDDKYINLEVDGEKVRIPLPEGYEVFTKEEYPEQYEYFYGPAWSRIALPLCGLVNSNDHKAGINTYDSTRIRFVCIDIERKYIPHRFSVKFFHDIMSDKKELNEEFEKNNYSKQLFIRKYIFEDITTHTELRIAKENINKSNGRIVYTKTYFLFNNIIISFRFYSWTKDINNYDRVIVETKNYITLLKKQLLLR